MIGYQISGRCITQPFKRKAKTGIKPSDKLITNDFEKGINSINETHSEKYYIR